MRKLIAMLVAGLLATTVLSACTSGDSSSSQGSSNVDENSSTAESSSIDESSSEKEAGYPVTITTYNFAGEEVTTTYESAPKKVIPVYQGSIETMIALGLEDHVVASYGLDNPIKDDWQEAFAKMNYNEKSFAPAKEEVTMLEPDLILSWGSIFSDKKLGDVSFWHEREVNTYINSNTRSGGHPRLLSNEYTDIINLGKIFGVEDKAKSIVAEMETEIETVVKNAPAGDKQSVMVIEFYDDSITNYASTSLAGDMISQLGGTLSLPEENNTSKEGLIAQNPDVIFVVYMAYSGDDAEDVKQTSLDKVLKDESLASLDAVKNGRVYPLMLGDMYASGVRTLDGIKTVANGLYPAK